MIRLVIAVATVYFALVQPAAAYAHAPASDTGDEPEAARGAEPAPSAPSMCADSSQTLFIDAFASGRIGLELPRAALQARPEESQPAWCVSPDDPRCAPRDTGKPLQTERVSVTACAVASVSIELAQYDEATRTPWWSEPGALASGFAHGLERPPRA